MLPKRIPFYFKAHNTKGNGGFSVTLPFDVYFDDELQMYRQRTTEQLKEILHKVYEQGSLIEGSVSNESGKIYLKKIMDFVNNVTDIGEKSILELGCGDGSMLIEFKKAGAKVIGLEPGNHLISPLISDIEIINDFFPSEKIKDCFDIIFHYGVLEHIEDPVEFLKEQVNYLTKGGKIIVCVPNCMPYLQTGDISLFIHEHYNYFTKQSLCNTLELAGLELEKIDIIEGMIAACVTIKADTRAIEKKEIDAELFQSSCNLFQAKLTALFNKYPENKIAVYVPLRALNILYVIDRPNLRLVDDSGQIAGKYLPFLNEPVESFEQMLTDPPDCLIIFSRTFGDRIKERCIKKVN
ncbi:MAG: class I SAM-dependent methyltransferase [Ferruginibacter sp.]